MKKIDMSEQAILRRLRTVDRLRELCLELMKAKKERDRKQTESDGLKNERDESAK